MLTITAMGLRSPGTRNNRDKRPRGRGCGKKCYPTQAAAFLAAESELSRNGFRAEKVRVYRCPECNAYHITGTPRSGKTTYVTRKPN
jgi:hypothetical protein